MGQFESSSAATSLCIQMRSDKSAVIAELSFGIICTGDDAVVKRVLLTGMSGTGKSTLITALAARGFKAVDMDEPEWSEYGPDGDWVGLGPEPPVAPAQRLGRIVEEAVAALSTAAATAATTSTERPLTRPA